MRVLRAPPERARYPLSNKFRVDGTNAELRIVVFMDDVDAPDIAFFTHPELARSIQAAIDEHMDAVGK